MASGRARQSDHRRPSRSDAGSDEQWRAPDMMDDRPGRPLRPPGMWGRSVALGLVLASAATPSPAQGPNRPAPASRVTFDTSTTAEALLRNADNHARGGQYAEAIEFYQRVIQQFGDK